MARSVQSVVPGVLLWTTYPVSDSPPVSAGGLHSIATRPNPHQRPTAVGADGGVAEMALDTGATTVSRSAPATTHSSGPRRMPSPSADPPSGQVTPDR